MAKVYLRKSCALRHSPGVHIRHNCPMQEVFSRIEQPGVSLHDQEFYELRLYESGDIWRSGHMILQARATWSEVDRQFMWDEIETERVLTLEIARERYSARRLALAEKGFVVSDMDI